MKLDFSNGVPPDVLDRIKRVKREVDGLESRSLYCPYCNHQSLIIYSDAKGHVQTKCKRCGQVSDYNIAFRIVSYRLSLTTRAC